MNRVTTDVDYDLAWQQWGDMIKYSPAPFHRRRLILKMAREIPFQSVLDVGCGNGEMLKVIHQYRQGLRLVGADLSSGVIEANRKMWPFAEFEVLDISTTSLPEQFDLIICSEVIEHVVNYRAALGHLRQMCRGHLILTVPTGKVFPIDQMMGHHQHFSSRDLSEALHDNHFLTEQIWTWGFPFHTIYKYLINLSPEASVSRFAGTQYTAIDKITGRLLTWLFYLNLYKYGNQLIISARVI